MSNVDENKALSIKSEKKFLTFFSDNLIFGINAEYVTEIITNHNITILPKVPKYISGILNLRGQIIPIIDIRLKMNKAPMDSSDQNCIIVADIDNIIIGILVDSVAQVIDIKEENVHPSPTNNSDGLINGIFTVGEKTVLALDCQKLISNY